MQAQEHAPASSTMVAAGRRMVFHWCWSSRQRRMGMSAVEMRMAGRAVPGMRQGANARHGSFHVSAASAGPNLPLANGEAVMRWASNEMSHIEPLASRSMKVNWRERVVSAASAVMSVKDSSLCFGRKSLSPADEPTNSRGLSPICRAWMPEISPSSLPSEQSSTIQETPTATGTVVCGSAMICRVRRRSMSVPPANTPLIFCAGRRSASRSRAWVRVAGGASCR